MDKAFRCTSYPEQFIALACKNTFKHVEQNKKMNNGMEADIVIYDINTIIEYNGKFWHSDESRDERKKNFIESHNIRLIRIWDSSATSHNRAYAKILDKDNIEFCRYNRDMLPVMDKLEKLLNTKLVYQDIKEDDILDIVNSNIRNQNLAYMYPDIASELLDGDPSKLFISDSKSRIWKCSKCGTEFKTSIGHRIFDKTSCPACAGNTAIPGKNDLYTLYRGYSDEILDLTDDEKIRLLPFSSKVVTWKCTKCNNIWKTTVSQRLSTFTGCPKCGYIPININYNDYVDIDYLYRINKPISNILLDNKIYNVNIQQAIGLVIKYILDLDIGGTIDDIITISNNICDKELLKQPIEVYKDKFIEGKSSTSYKISILYKIVKAYNIDILFKLKKPDKLPNRITLAKNGRSYNATTRIDGKIIYIGNRDTPVDATVLKLSAEIYFFGDILNKADIEYIGNKKIPDFREMQEYSKFRDKTGGNKNETF